MPQFILQQQRLPPRRSERALHASRESLHRKRARRCSRSHGSAEHHAPPGPRRHDLRFPTDPQNAPRRRQYTHPGLDARRLPDADARLAIQEGHKTITSREPGWLKEAREVSGYADRVAEIEEAWLRDGFQDGRGIT